MGTHRQETKENSVKIALQEIQVMENNRQESEEQELIRRKEEEERRLAEERRAQKEAEDLRNKELEEARLVAKQAAEEAAEARALAEKERRLRIELEAKQLEHGFAQQYELDHEKNFQNLETYNKKLKQRIVVIPVSFVLTVGIAGFAWHHSHEKQLAAERQALLGQHNRFQTDSEAERQQLKQELARAQKEAQQYLKDLTSSTAPVEEKAGDGHKAHMRDGKTRPLDTKPKPRRGTKKQSQKKSGSRLSDDPMGGFNL